MATIKRLQIFYQGGGFIRREYTETLSRGTNNKKSASLEDDIEPSNQKALAQKKRSQISDDITSHEGEESDKNKIEDELCAEVMALVNENNVQLEEEATQLDKFKTSVESRFQFAQRFLKDADEIDISCHGTELNAYLSESLQKKMSHKNITDIEFGF
ncbi:unnamed protein product [Mytilus coruscus]|uniref:Uncharacterized protein n=1 Tax=Mytilus coruscus TaxID=42192 RepID=A0A6J8B448_MYTCO|nr:unnamed protein product [Mytilus coruscus]